MTMKTGKTIKTLAAAAALASLAGASAVAQTGTPAAAAGERTGTNVAERAGTESPAARGVVLARDALALAQRARASRDALAMLVAANELRAAGTQAGEGPQTTAAANPGAMAAAEGAAPTTPAPTAASLYAEARQLAAGDRDLLRRIDRAERTQARGLVGGPVTFVRDISANSTLRWQVMARGGEVWRVGAMGDGDTDVDIRVIDENGNVVCQDLGMSSTALCTVNPRWTGPFTVEIINWGRVWTRTVIASN